jgi:hypothetical protein
MGSEASEDLCLCIIDGYSTSWGIVAGAIAAGGAAIPVGKAIAQLIDEMIQNAASGSDDTTDSSSSAGRAGAAQPPGDGGDYDSCGAPPRAPCRWLSRPNSIANETGYTAKQVKEAIHSVKNEGGWRDMGSRKNPDVLVNPRTGDVHPQLPDGSPGDIIGNIFDYLPSK